MSKNTQILNGIEYKYSAEWINKLENFNHWNNYYYQQKIIQGKIRKNEKREKITRSLFLQLPSLFLQCERFFLLRV